MHSRLFSDKEFNQKLIRIALPLTLQSFMLAAVAASDTFMLGVVEQNAMSAVSLASKIQFIQNIVVCSVSAVISMLGAQYWGKKSKHTCGKVLGIGLHISTLVSFLFFAGCLFIPRTLMSVFTNSAELIDIGEKYLKIAGWSYLLTGPTQCLLSLLKVTGNERSSATISISAVVINILLNAVFIYGLFGLPALGVSGAAIATLIARCLEMLASILVMGFKNPVNLRFSSLFGFPKQLLGDFFRQLPPLMIAYGLWGIGFTGYSAMIGRLGEDAIAANSIASVVMEIACCACNGLASASEILVGHCLGAGDLEKGKQYGERLERISFLCGGCAALILLAVTPILMIAVSLTQQARSLLLGMMFIMAFYSIGRCVNTIVINGVFQAGGYTKFDMITLCIFMWGLAIPLAALGTFVFHWPVYVIYACTCLDEVGKIPVVIIHFKKYRWVKNLTRSEE